MTILVKIDDGAIDVAEFLRTLKLNGQFEGLIEQVVRDRLTVYAANGRACKCRKRKSRSAPTSSGASAACIGLRTRIRISTRCRSRSTNSRPS